MSATSDISGMLRGLRQAKEKALRAALRGLDLAGEHVLGQAQQLTPVDTGALQASATSEPARSAGASISKLIGFNTDYAAVVHERLDVHHPIGQAKYLETALRRNAEKVPQFVAQKIREALT